MGRILASILIISIGLQPSHGQGTKESAKILPIPKESAKILSSPGPKEPVNKIFSKGTIAKGATKMYELDPERFENQKKLVCPTIPDFASGNVPAWTDILTENEVFELAFLNMGYGLTSDAIAQLPADLGFKKVVIDLIAHIADTTCDTDAISAKFLNGAKNLFLYYLIKIDRAAANSTTNSENNATDQATWAEIIPALLTCSGEVEPIAFEETCGVVNNFQHKDGTWEPTGIINEQFDEEISSSGLGIDIIVDSVWWMFSLSYARCYSYFYPNEDIILLFLQRFREDIMDFFDQRWRGAGAYREHFDIIFGPFDVDDDYNSLRMCATAAYDFEGLSGRHLIRPVTVTVDNRRIRNYKIPVDK